jgi:Tol biopolymer transport system component
MPIGFGSANMRRAINNVPIQKLNDMKFGNQFRRTTKGRDFMVFLFFLVAVKTGAAGNLIQPVSIVNTPPVVAPAGGSGDSLSPIITPDGRYILFASSANNLVLNPSANPAPVTMPPAMNIFLRDRLKQTTTLVSVSLDGTGMGNGDSIAAGISTNGQFALFESAANNLVAGDTNGVNDIFVRDLVANVTTLVTVSTNGGAGNGTSRSSVMTPDGRYVAFVSAANNLAPGATNGMPNVFVRDLQADTTTLANPGATPFSNASSSELPLITPDGRYVAFYSTATNLVAGITNSGEIYVRDLTQGTTRWASTNSHSILQTLGTNCDFSCNEAISDNGQWVAYEACPPSGPGIVLEFDLGSGLTAIVNTNVAAILPGQELNERNLTMTPDGRFIAFVPYGNGINTRLAVWDAPSNTTAIASLDINQLPVTNAIFDWPAITPDGSLVAFASDATNLTASPVVAGFHLYVRNMMAGTNELVDVDTNGVGSMSNLMTFPRISDNGAVVAFDGLDGSLVGNDNNHAYDVFARNLPTSFTELISAGLAGLPSATPNGSCFISSSSVSSNGQYVAFSSEADNLAGGDANGLRDVFVHDAGSGTNILVSINTNGVPGNGFSTDPAMSGNGRYVAFTSGSSDLVPNDTNNVAEIFLRDLQGGTTSLVSVNTNGGPGDGASYSPAISADGRYVVFVSDADNLVPGSVGDSYGNLFWRDTQSGMTRALTSFSGSTFPTDIKAAITPDGQRVAFGLISEDSDGSSYSALCIWDVSSNQDIYTNSTTVNINDQPAISPDGNRAVFFETNEVLLLDLTEKKQVSFTNAFSHASGQFSADSQSVAFVAGTNQIYRYNFPAGTNLLVSAGANARCDSPTISADGRFIAYRSYASNLTANATNGVPNILLYDALSGTTTLVSASPIGNAAANSRSLNPVFSGDGQMLVWESWANNLAGQDFNQWCNIYALRSFATNSTAGPGEPFTISSFGISSLASLGSSAGASTLVWPASALATYQVQFTTNLSNPQWQPVNNAVRIIGTEGYLLDPGTNDSQKFYRVIESQF